MNVANLHTAGTGFNNSVSFYYLARTQVSTANSTPATNLQFGNAQNFASWTLAADGTATYSLAAVSTVPMPPSLWMLGFGLAALGATLRRRQPASSARFNG